jgi:hypothetical protein
MWWSTLKAAMALAARSHVSDPRSCAGRSPSASVRQRGRRSSLNADCARYRDTILAHLAMIEWIAQAYAESEHIEELDAEF